MQQPGPAPNCPSHQLQGRVACQRALSAAEPSTSQALPEASACSGAQRGAQHGRVPRGFCERSAAEGERSGQRLCAALRWAEAGYLPVNPLVRTAIRARCTQHSCLFCLLAALIVCWAARISVPALWAMASTCVGH